MGRSGPCRGLPGGGLHRGLAFTLVVLAGCAYKLGPPQVAYGDPEPLVLVQPSTDTRRWYVPVESETLGPQIFFVDTGYGYTACDDDLVEGLGLMTKGRIRVRGELGVLKATKTRLPDLVLGGHTLSGITCQVRDLGETSSIRDPREVPVAGVLGMDVFRQFRMIIAPETGTIRLLDPKAVAPLDRKDPRVVRLRREWFGQRTRVPLTLQLKTTWPLLDTGSTTTWIDGERLGLEVSRRQEGVTFRGTGRTKRCQDCDTTDRSGPGHRLTVPDWANGMPIGTYLSRRYPDLSRTEITSALQNKRVQDDAGQALTPRTRLVASQTLVLNLPGIGPTSSAPADIRTMYYYDLPHVEIGSEATGSITLTDRQRGPYRPGLLGLNVLAQYHQELDPRQRRALYRRIEPTGLDSWAHWHRAASGGGGVLLDGATSAATEATPP